MGACRLQHDSAVHQPEARHRAQLACSGNSGMLQKSSKGGQWLRVSADSCVGSPRLLALQDVAMFNPGGHWGRMTRQSAASVRSHAYSAKGSHISRALSGRGSGSAKSHVSWAAKSHISWAARSVRSYKSMGAKSRGGMSTKSRVYSVAGTSERLEKCRRG
jgi:hypothetical protein